MFVPWREHTPCVCVEAISVQIGRRRGGLLPRKFRRPYLRTSASLSAMIERLYDRYEIHVQQPLLEARACPRGNAGAR